MSVKRKTACFLLLAAAVCCVLYGFAVKAIRSGTAFYAVWFALGAVLLALAETVRRRLWARLPERLRRCVLVMCGLLLALFVAVEGLILSGFGSRGEEGLDYIIVLGAQVREDGPSYVLRRRLIAALEYLESNPETMCVVSGGRGANEPFPEAEGMAAFLTENGIDAQRIIIEDRSSSTVENIRNSLSFIPEGASVGIVTNNFHVYRAVQTAKRLGIQDPSGIAGDLRPFYLPNSMLREFLAILKFWIIG